MKFNFSVKYVTYYFNIKVNQRYFEISFRQPEREKKKFEHYIMLFTDTSKPIRM